MTTYKLPKNVENYVRDVALCAVNTQSLYKNCFRPCTLVTAEIQFKGGKVNFAEALRSFYDAALLQYKRDFPEDYRPHASMPERYASEKLFGEIVAENYSEEIAYALAELKAKRPRVAVFIEGGIVQSVLTDIPGGARLAVVDYDTEGANLSDCTQVKQEDGSSVDAYVWHASETEAGAMLENAFRAQGELGAK